MPVRRRMTAIASVTAVAAAAAGATVAIGGDNRRSIGLTGVTGTRTRIAPHHDFQLTSTGPRRAPHTNFRGIPMSLTFSRRVLTSATGLALAASGLVAFAASPSHAASPAYQMPFSCDQQWTGRTYDGHTPGPVAIDWTRSAGTVNQPVLASAEGTVSVAKTLSGSYGKYVVIDHGGGASTLYAHLNDYEVSVGQRVTRGQKIGIVGSTGNSTGAHLHYEQKLNGYVKQSVFNGVPFSMGSTLASKNCGQAPEVPPLETGWRAQVAVQTGSSVFHGIRSSDRRWTGFANVAGATGEVPSGAREVAEAGVNGDNHLLAVGNDGKLYHTIRFTDRSWAGYGDVTQAAGAPGTITQATAVSVGADLYVAVVADGVVHYTVRFPDGTWKPFVSLGSPGGAPTTKVVLARTGTDVQFVAVAGGVLQHTVRKADGSFSAWGDASAEAGLTGVEDVAVAGTGSDLQLVATAAGGTKQYHGIRFGTGHWQSFRDLSEVISGVTVTDVAAAAVDGELQVGFVATDGRVLHTIRHAGASWDAAAALDLAGVPANRTGIAITGTYN
ncbi:peptidoglycan DD-metalloendopeptidase family protein [Streptomyces sp. NPDC048255]|uniref:peptidoglycan DD-metalloendopeptidase family protein n=1 Tax=Streptomyces sp. NPDC048255 TaxID=3154713 RepID=UPI0033D31DFA